MHTYILDNLVNYCPFYYYYYRNLFSDFCLLPQISGVFVARSEQAEVQEVSESVLLDLPGSDGKMLKCAEGSHIHFIDFMTSIMYQTQG